jgi:hypothetical protein
MTSTFERRSGWREFHSASETVGGRGLKKDVSVCRPDRQRASINGEKKKIAAKFRDTKIIFFGCKSYSSEPFEADLFIARSSSVLFRCRDRECEFGNA